MGSFQRSRLKEKPTTHSTAFLKEERIIQNYKSRVHSPLTAIRSHCVECMGGSVHEITDCTSPDCSLFPLRMGKNAFDKRVVKRQQQENIDE